MFYTCIEYHIWVNMYHVSAQGVDERIMNVHYYLLLNEAGASFFDDVTLVEFTYLVFTRMPGESYRRPLSSLFLCLCDVF